MWCNLILWQSRRIAWKMNAAQKTQQKELKKGGKKNKEMEILCVYKWTHQPTHQNIAFSETLKAILDEIMILNLNVSSTLNCRNVTCIRSKEHES